MYQLAEVWVKPNARSQSGTAATYLTEVTKKDNGGTQKNEAKKGKDGEKKPTRDLSKVKCYGYGKKGHLKNSPLCPKNLKKQNNQEGKEAFMNTTCCEEIEEVCMQWSGLKMKK